MWCTVWLFVSSAAAAASSPLDKSDSQAFDHVRVENDEQTRKIFKSYFETRSYVNGATQPPAGHKHVTAVHADPLLRAAEQRLIDARLLEPLHALIAQLERMQPLVTSVGRLLDNAVKISKVDRARDRIARHRRRQSSDATLQFIGELRPVATALNVKDVVLKQLEALLEVNVDVLDLESDDEPYGGSAKRPTKKNQVADDLLEALKRYTGVDKNGDFKQLLINLTLLLHGKELQQLKDQRVAEALREFVSVSLPANHDDDYQYEAPSLVKKFGATRAYATLQALQDFVQLPAYRNTLALFERVDLIGQKVVTDTNVTYYVTCSLGKEIDPVKCIDMPEFNHQISEIAKTKQNSTVIWNFGLAKRIQGSIKTDRIETATTILMCVNINGVEDVKPRRSASSDRLRKATLTVLAVKASQAAEPSASMKPSNASSSSTSSSNTTSSSSGLLAPPVVIPPPPLSPPLPPMKPRVSHRRASSRLDVIGETIGAQPPTVGAFPPRGSGSPTYLRKKSQFNRRPLGN